ncbi:MAG: hypothetical protein HY000_15615 [Planctomycetes bacterium]|nr:hypothetical protein [Planctomycetota bacterium]
MNAQLITEDVLSSLERRFGRRQQVSRGRIFRFGSACTCSINYSKLLGGHKYFFALPSDIINPSHAFAETTFGEFALLICGSADKVLVLPRPLVIEMMRGVPTRRVDVFHESGTYILQTTKHPKRDITTFLNAFPSPRRAAQEDGIEQEAAQPDRVHVRIQWALIRLGNAEGCSVWVPPNDRNLSYKRQPFSNHTLGRLPHFGFEENTRRIVQNIDVLWLARNVIRKAFEIESTTSIYSGLLRLNDLTLAQPKNRIDLYLAAPKARRQRVHDQLIRPSFQTLLPVCTFLSFEAIEEQMKRIESLPVESGARVTGLIGGERFALPEHLVYPAGV